MENLPITLDNFWRCSTGDFEEIPIRPKRKPDFISKNATGEPSSYYWYEKENEEDVVIRYSDHWGWAINCFWTIDGTTDLGPWRCGKTKVSSLTFNMMAVEGLLKKISYLPDEARRFLKESF